MICTHCKRQIDSPKAVCPYCQERLFPIGEGRSSEIYGAMPEKKKAAVKKIGAAPNGDITGDIGGASESKTDSSGQKQPVGGLTHRMEPFEELTVRAAEIKTPQVKRSRRLTALMPDTKAGGRNASLGPQSKQKVAGSKPGRDEPRIGASKASDGSFDRAEIQKKGARSQPISAKGARTSRLDSEPQMLKKHEYVAIVPVSHGTKNFNWMRLCVIAFVCITMITVGVYVFLTRHSMGQYWLASLGREASVEAYHELGRQKMISGSITGAIRALEIAQSKSPDDFEVLLDLGMAYKGNNQMREAELAYTRAAQVSPSHPEPYRYIIQIMQEEGRNSEALELVKYAIEQTQADYFNTLYAQIVPKTPSADKLDGTQVKELDIPIQADEGAAIYYTIDNTDPKEQGILYTPNIVDGEDKGIHLEEGTWRLRAVAYVNEMFSEEMVRTYIVSKPVPDMPKANLSSGTYDSVKSVSLRGPKDSIIYYTVDGSTPTDKSKVYNEPIKLRIGKTTLKAIAVNVENKVSGVMEVTYQCNGRTKATMAEKDTVDGLELYKTTKEQFIEKYGEPTSAKPDGSDSVGTYEKLTYSFGYAVFLTRKSATSAILVELSTSSSSFEGPRDTRVGIRMENVIDAFRDDGGEENSRGGRDLYRMTDGRLGFIIKESVDPGETSYNESGNEENGLDDCKVSYYLEVKSKQFIELTYHVNDGIVERIEWLRYEVP